MTIMPKKKLVGEIVHYFDRIGVAVLKASDTIKVGDSVFIEGAGDGFEQVITSMQMEHEQVKEVKKGQSVGVKVDKPVKEGYKVYRSSE